MLSYSELFEKRPELNETGHDGIKIHIWITRNVLLIQKKETCRSEKESGFCYTVE